VQPDIALDPASLAMYLLGAAAVGVIISLFAYWQGQWRSAKKRAYAASAGRLADRLKSLEAEDPAETVGEALRRLAEP
jgi:hypothetical protein